MDKDKNPLDDWLGSFVGSWLARYHHNMWIKLMPQKITNDPHQAFCKVLWNVPDPVLLNMCVQVMPHNLFYMSVPFLPMDPISSMTA